MSSAKQTDSFSLPSAGGMVSLLNDNGTNTKTKSLPKRQSKDDALQHTDSSSSNDDGYLAVAQSHGRRSNSNTSTYNTPSPFSSDPSAGERNGSSTEITVPSTDSSSRDDSVGPGKLSRNARERGNAEHHGSRSTSTSTSENQQRVLNVPQRTDTVYSSSPSVDDEQNTNDSPPEGASSGDGKLSPTNSNDNADAQVGRKRRRQTDTRADKTVQSRGVSMQKMLDSSRIARSPMRMRDDDDVDLDENGEEEEEGDETHEERTKDVPMNMHRATATKDGGFGGQTQLDDGDDKRVQKQLDRSPSSARRRSSVGSTTSSVAQHGSSTSRKAGSSSQIIGGKKRYPCSFRGCDKTFSTSGHAARHNRIHTGSKPYRCTFPGCHASFSRQDNSLQHYRTHVLHPKSRNGGSISLDASQEDPAAVDSELAHLDPETVATVQMGRKALEEGTAIAVVQEFIDGHGRRAEAVQRMVGQPKSGRRGSVTTSTDSTSATLPSHSAPTPINGGNWDAYGSEMAHKRHSSSSGRPSVSDHQLGWQHHPHDVDPRTGQPFPPPPPPEHVMWERGGYAHAYPENVPLHPQHGHAYAHAPPSPPRHPLHYQHDYHHNNQPYAHHTHPQASEADAYTHRYAHGPVHRLHEGPPPAFAHGFSAADAREHARRSSYGPSPYHEHAHSLPRPPYHEVARAPVHAPDFNARLRRRSDNVTMNSSTSNRVTGHPALPPYNDRHNTAMYSSNPTHGDRGPAALAPPQQLAEPSGAQNSKHRRSASAAMPAPYIGDRPSYDEYGRPLTSHSYTEQRSPIDAPSPSFSVRSFRSEGQFASSAQRDECGSALSLLSNAAARSGGAGSPVASTSTSTKGQPLPAPPLVPESRYGGRARSSTKGDMHLTLPRPAPPPALSKVPYSSDRSTNGLTPTLLPPATTAQDDRRRSGAGSGLAPLHSDARA